MFLIVFFSFRYNKLGLDGSVRDGGDVPIILKLAGQMSQSDLSKSSLILSSLYANSSSKTKTKVGDGECGSSVGDGDGGSVKTRKSAHVEHVEKCMTFQHSGSPLLNSDVVSVAMGTNHSAFIKS